MWVNLAVWIRVVRGAVVWRGGGEVGMGIWVVWCGVVWCGECGYPHTTDPLPGQDPELVQKNEEGYVDFTIEPETHAGYAATW